MRIGLFMAGSDGDEVLCVLSPTLAACPTDWDVDIHFTGDLRPPEMDHAPPAELWTFLGDGSALVMLRSLPAARPGQQRMKATADQSLKDRARLLANAMAKEDGMRRAADVTQATFRQGGLLD